MKKKTLVFGASANPERYAYLAMERLVKNGHEVVAFGLKKGLVAGVQIDTEPMPYENLDTVTLYMNPLRQREFYDYIVSLRPRRVIFNPGTENPEFQKRLDDHAIAYENACTLVLLSTDRY